LSLVPLRLGTLAVAGYDVVRSGVRWLRDEGHACRAGELVAYCNLRFAPSARAPASAAPFAEEARDFQVGFATRVGGRLHRAHDASRGGFIDRLAEHTVWMPNHVIGHVQCRPSERPAGVDPDGETLELMLVAGRRVTEIAEDRSGFLTGWHDRVRAWWGEGDAPVGTLLGYGICEQLGVFRGESPAFSDWFGAVAGPAQVVYVPDNVLVPCAAVVAEQCLRTANEAEAIRADVTQSIANGPVVPTPADWMFVGALISALLRSPLTERCDVPMRRGLAQADVPDAVVLSLNAESQGILRHRRLGYRLQCHAYRMSDAGPAVRAWIERDFEHVSRSVDDIGCDLRALADRVRERATTALLVMNTRSTSGFETFHSYAPFDRPLGNMLGSVRAKELNLMLHDLARERNVSIVDNDAIAADLGATHLPDGVHNSATMQAELRGEILRILRGRGIAGFAARPSR